MIKLALKIAIFSSSSEQNILDEVIIFCKIWVLEIPIL